jgi:hypothetical protein
MHFTEHLELGYASNTCVPSLVKDKQTAGINGTSPLFQNQKSRHHFVGFHRVATFKPDKELE